MKKIALALSIWLGMQGLALAMTIEEQVRSSLTEQGYEIIEEGYTFLGRLRIVAVRGDIRREIVVDPRTGEILRDYAEVWLRPGSGEDGASNPGASANLLKQSAEAEAQAPVLREAEGEAASEDPSAESQTGAAGVGGNEATSETDEADLGLKVILGDPLLPTGDAAK
jgi:hypothetical protein